MSHGLKNNYCRNPASYSDSNYYRTKMISVTRRVASVLDKASWKLFLRLPHTYSAHFGWDRVLPKSHPAQSSLPKLLCVAQPQRGVVMTTFVVGLGLDARGAAAAQGRSHSNCPRAS